MNTSNTGIELIKKFEGCKLTAYQDTVGVWTIGIGHTKGVYKGLTITKEYAEKLLKQDLQTAEKHVASYNAIYHWTQAEFDALVSFAFNIGNINGLTKNGSRSKKEVARKILEYNKAGGRTLAGLTARRKAEQDMFLGKQVGETFTNVDMPTIKEGNKGTAVVIWQKILGIEIDGKFGSKTKETTIAFQKKHFASQRDWDGVVGAKTWKEGAELLTK